MTRDLWLVCLQHFHEETDADFRIAHQVNQPQTRAICERLKEEFNAVVLVAHYGDLPANSSSSYYDSEECRVPIFIKDSYQI